jgi:hypothetical protein
MFVSVDRQSMIFIKEAHPEFSSRLTNLLNLISKKSPPMHTYDGLIVIPLADSIFIFVGDSYLVQFNPKTLDCRYLPLRGKSFRYFEHLFFYKTKCILCYVGEISYLLYHNSKPDSLFVKIIECINPTFYPLPLYDGDCGPNYFIGFSVLCEDIRAVELIKVDLTQNCFYRHLYSLPTPVTKLTIELLSPHIPEPITTGIIRHSYYYAELVASAPDAPILRIYDEQCQNNKFRLCFIDGEYRTTADGHLFRNDISGKEYPLKALRTEIDWDD